MDRAANPQIACQPRQQQVRPDKHQLQRPSNRKRERHPGEPKPFPLANALHEHLTHKVVHDDHGQVDAEQRDHSVAGAEVL